MRRSKFAAHRFAHEAVPALQRSADSLPTTFMARIEAAQDQIVARKDEVREDFLRK